MKNIILICCLFLASCGQYVCNEDFFASDVICVKTNGFLVEKDKVETIYQISLERTIEKFGNEQKIKNKIEENKINLNFQNEIPQCGKDYITNGCEISSIDSGYNVCDFEIYVKFKDCYEIVVLHEFLHVFQSSILSGSEKKYKEILNNPHPIDWFGYVNSLEGEVLEYIFSKYCE